jgi:hypothetical protein
MHVQLNPEKRRQCGRHLHLPRVRLGGKSLSPLDNSGSLGRFQQRRRARIVAPVSLFVPREEVK